MLRKLLPIGLISLLVTGCVTTSATLPTPIATRPAAVAPQATLAATATPSPFPTETPFPTIVLPSLTPYPDDVQFSIGQTVEGRDINVWQFGSGEQAIILIGGIHGGYEANTILLADQMIDYFRDNPQAILDDISIVIIPNANPDGTERGSGIDGRFNARGVDLNRNWGCDWSETAFLRDRPVDPGSRPFSEPESVALRQFFVSEEPAAVIFYHSALGGIFLGACDDDSAQVQQDYEWFGELLSDATGYPYYEEFDFYEIKGDATNWLAERGVPAAVVETYSRTDPEFERNLRGVIAIQCELSDQRLAGELTPSEDYIELCG